MMGANIELYEVGLFDRAPLIGAVSPEGEVRYVGYKRVPIAVLDGKNINEVQFTKVDQDQPVFVSHAVIFDGSGVVVGVNPLTT